MYARFVSNRSPLLLAVGAFSAASACASPHRAPPFEPFPPQPSTPPVQWGTPWPTVPVDPEKIARLAATCHGIASDIEALKPRFAQLSEFDSSAKKYFVMGGFSSCRIGYTYHCHRSSRRGGWSTLVPNPDPDGVWFHVGLWDESDPSESMSQINTQPSIPRWHIEGQKVTYLILEGEKSTPLSGEIFQILKNHGLTQDD
jgi:hypothetical protein